MRDETAFLSPLALSGVVKSALEEDLGRAGDVTSQAVIPLKTAARGVFRARQPLVVCGLEYIAETFRQLGSEMSFVPTVRDGDSVEQNAIIATLEGCARTLLAGERTALNFLNHLSGIASLTACYVKKVEHTKALIVDTRKTIPGLRALAKYAVRCGGGGNHRYGLDDAVLIKDNHIAVAGGVSAALTHARARIGHLMKIEIEVDRLDQLDEVLDSGLADVVLLDNMDLIQMRHAVEKIDGRLITEASGGVSLETVTAIAETGVDLISVGRITHSAPYSDVGLDVEV